MNRPTYIVTLSPVGADDVPAEVRLKRALKFLLRSCALKALDVRTVAGHPRPVEARHAPGPTRHTPQAKRSLYGPFPVQQRRAGRRVCGTGRDVGDFQWVLRRREIRRTQASNSKRRK